MRLSCAMVPVFVLGLAAVAQAQAQVFDAGESSTLGQDFDFQNSVTTINANWTAFAASYEWAIGTTPGGQQVQAFTANGILNGGTGTSGTVSTLTLTAGAIYFVSVRAAPAGVPVASDGITVRVPPTASALVVTAGTQVDFVFPIQGIILFEWDFDVPSPGDLSLSRIDFTSATSGNGSFTYTLPGTYDAEWRVSHVGGDVESGKLVILVNPSPNAPTVGLTATPGSGDAPLTVNLTAPVVTQDGSVAAVYWDFDGDLVPDASSAGSTSITHTFGEPGTYPVVVTVVDGLGNEGTGTINVVVNAPPGYDPPVISGLTAGPSPAPAGTIVTIVLDVTAGSTGTVTRLEFDFENDGEVDRVMTAPIPATVVTTWQFMKPTGGFIKVTAYDSQGFSVRDFVTHTTTLDPAARRCLITQPVDGARVWGDHLSVLAAVFGDSPVQSVEFQFRPNGGAAWTTIGSAIPTREEIFGVHWDVTGLTPGGLYDLRAVTTFVGSGATVSSEAIQLVTVQVQQGAPPLPTQLYYEEFSGSPFTLFQIVGVLPNLTTLGAINGNTLIQLPPGAVGSYEQMRMERRAEALQTVAARLQGLKLVHRRKLSFGGNSPFLKPGKVSMYVGPSGPVLPDGTDLTKVKLKVLRFEPSRNRWEPLQKQIHTPTLALVKAQAVAGGDLAVAYDDPTPGGESSVSCGGLGVEGVALFLLLVRRRRRRDLGVSR